MESRYLTEKIHLNSKCILIIKRYNHVRSKGRNFEDIWVKHFLIIGQGMVIQTISDQYCFTTEVERTIIFDFGNHIKYDYNMSILIKEIFQKCFERAWIP